MESLWGVATIVGPILLLAVIVWAWASNRKAGAPSERQADAGAKQLREEIQAEDERRGNT